MTREEIRTKWIRNTTLLKLDECVDNAMDQYAKQVAIGFHRWKEERFLDITYKITYDGDDIFMPKISFVTPPPRFTIEQLFDQYIDSLNK